VKTLKSRCEKIWLFDAEVDDISIKAGLACFLLNAQRSQLLLIKTKKLKHAYH